MVVTFTLGIWERWAEWIGSTHSFIQLQPVYRHREPNVLYTENRMVVGDLVSLWLQLITMHFNPVLQIK